MTNPTNAVNDTGRPFAERSYPSYFNDGIARVGSLQALAQQVTVDPTTGLPSASSNQTAIPGDVIKGVLFTTDAPTRLALSGTFANLAIDKTGWDALLLEINNNLQDIENMGANTVAPTYVATPVAASPPIVAASGILFGQCSSDDGTGITGVQAANNKPGASIVFVPPTATTMRLRGFAYRGGMPLATIGGNAFTSILLEADCQGVNQGTPVAFVQGGVSTIFRTVLLPPAAITAELIAANMRYSIGSLPEVYQVVGTYE